LSVSPYSCLHFIFIFASCGNVHVARSSSLILFLWFYLKKYINGEFWFKLICETKYNYFLRNAHHQTSKVRAHNCPTLSTISNIIFFSMTRTVNGTLNGHVSTIFTNWHSQIDEFEKCFIEWGTKFKSW